MDLLLLMNIPLNLHTKVFQDGSVVRIFYHKKRNEFSFTREVEKRLFNVWLINNGNFNFELSKFTKKGILTKQDQLLQQEMKEFVKEVINELKRNKKYRLKLLMDIYPKKMMDILF